MRTDESDQQIRSAIRDWLNVNAPTRVPTDLSGLEIAVLAEFPDYTIHAIRELYGPIVAVRSGMSSEVAAAAAAPPATSLHPPAVHRGIRPVVASDNLSRLSAVDMDVARLRAYATVPDPMAPDGIRIKFPLIYDRALQHSMRALELNMKIGQQLYDLDRVRAYVQRLGEIVNDRLANVAPEVIEEIAADIDQLNADFTAPARHGRL